MLDNLADPLTVDDLAEQAHMSRRTFIRRFREETGTTPMAWLTDARIDRARELLEASAVPVEQVGRLTGFGAPASLRAAFHRHLGTSAPRHLGTSAPRPRNTGLCSATRRNGRGPDRATAAGR
ncbi:helix-turn-helix domain-containing protein [Streptomyces sp. NPDC059679]|uniref:helix-turn-helix domain-containing protein n=1 Tax=Streptomyces sp. NPDC059679 TaxID=3346903 RepID=UPI0036AAE581